VPYRQLHFKNTMTPYQLLLRLSYMYAEKRGCETAEKYSCIFRFFTMRISLFKFTVQHTNTNIHTYIHTYRQHVNVGLAQACPKEINIIYITVYYMQLYMNEQSPYEHTSCGKYPRLRWACIKVLKMAALMASTWSVLCPSSLLSTRSTRAVYTLKQN